MNNEKGPAPTGPHANAPVIIPDARIERKSITRVSAADPCKICGKTDWCQATIIPPPQRQLFFPFLPFLSLTQKKR